MPNVNRHATEISNNEAERIRNKACGACDSYVSEFGLCAWDDEDVCCDTHTCDRWELAEALAEREKSK